MENQKTTTGLPSLPISTLFAMTFGFFGVNMAFSLQSSQMGRIFKQSVLIRPSLASSSFCRH